MNEENLSQNPLHEIDFKYRLIQSNHHLSHARYGYWTSPFLDCTVLVVDAIGEWDIFTQWKVIDGNFTKQKSWRYPKSIGLFYSAMTQAVGWKPMKKNIFLWALQQLKNTKLKITISSKSCGTMANFHTGININFDKFEIASIAQEIYEEEFKKIIDEIEDDNLVFVGGCALNVSANRFLTQFNTFMHAIW